MRRRLVLLLSVVGLTAAVAGCSGSQSASPGAGSSGSPSVADASAALVSERCTVCHSVDRIKEARHDAAAWADTVTRMRGKGARLSDDQAQQVVDFLAGGGATKL